MFHYVGVYVLLMQKCVYVVAFFFFQAEDGIRDLVRSRGLGDVYKRQIMLDDKSYLKSTLITSGTDRGGEQSILDSEYSEIPEGNESYDQNLSLIHI